MKRITAKRVIANALTAYIEDCSGVGTPETDQIEKAWDKVREPALTPLEMNELKVILKSLEPTSDLHKTLDKVIKALK
jgi:hypothetical protein